MRIVHVVHAFGTGGMEKGVATLIRNASPGFEHAVLCLTRSGASERLLPEGTPVVQLGKRPGHSLLFLLRLARALKSLRPAIVHTRNWGGMDGVIAARIAGIRQVVHGEHGWTLDDPYGRSSGRIRARRFLSRWVREYTCVSQGMERWLRSTVRVGVPVTQIYNGVDSERYRPADGEERVRAELGISKDEFVVTICGRLDPIKDHSTLFRAFASVRSAGVATRLLVVGDGAERQRLEREAGDGTVFLGDRQDVPDILRATDVFALTSLNEGISNTILEAMATGLPVVATRVGGNTELVVQDETGVLVDPRDSTAVAGSLLEYHRAPRLRAEHGAAGRDRSIREFGVAAMVAAYENVYKRLGAASKRG
jgi:sugar transferase (PEP-CTERM/EpsH1 system associated)